MNYNYEKGQYATIPFAYNDAEGTLVIGDRTGDFPGMLKERTFNVVKVSKDQPQPFDLKAKGTTVKYDGKAQTVNYNQNDRRRCQGEKSSRYRSRRSSVPNDAFPGARNFPTSE